MEPGRPRFVPGGLSSQRGRQSGTGINNRPTSEDGESDRPILAGKRVTTVERRGLIGNAVYCHKGELRLDYVHTTEEPARRENPAAGESFPPATEAGQKAKREHLACASRREFPRKPDAGNPHVRFDEGRGDLKSLSYSTG